MVELLIKNGLIVTMDKDRRIIADGSVAIDEGRIVSVKKGFAGKSKSEEVIDAKGKIVMPGLICSHTHLYGMLLRAAPLKIEPPTDFSQILQRVWWPMDEAMTKDDAYASALISCLEFIKTGTTLFADTFSGPNALSGVLDRIAAAVEESGMRGIISFEATERHTHTEGARGIKENERFILKVKKERKHRVHGMFSIHASFTVSDELFRYVRELASRYKVPLTVHTSEGLCDLYHNYERYGKRTIERLRDAEVLGPDAVLAHCVHVNDDELAIIKKTGAKVAHNPMSNMLNAVGVAPVVKMLSMGIPVGLGNDGYIFDGFENIRAAFLLHKIGLRDPRVVSAMEALEMATIKGAELYGLENELGSIEPGKLADIIIINPKRAPTPIVPESVVGHLVNTVCGKDVETVIVGGNILMRDRKMLSMEEEEVIKISRKSAEKLWQKLGAIKKR
ncbi:MAG: amidohydrolase family protein [Candidatus Hadarchaeum sp.]|uniref:amidohydrolase family protein n=1 Tax=Candidatus Hadarchaeum sp. TaxID=2883567 RepID=UPI003D11D18F